MTAHQFLLFPLLCVRPRVRAECGEQAGVLTAPPPAGPHSRPQHQTERRTYSALSTVHSLIKTIKNTTYGNKLGLGVHTAHFTPKGDNILYAKSVVILVDNTGRFLMLSNMTQPTALDRAGLATIRAWL